MAAGEGETIVLVAPSSLAVVDELDLGTLAASAVAYSRPAILHGWSVAESTGAGVAKFRIHDGVSIGGSVLARVTLASGGSAMALADDIGIRAVSGLFVEVVSGSIELTLYLRAED